jgi:hypothetical protein
MHRRSFIREGDTLTPGGGRVQPRPQPFASTYDERLACFEGDPVYCDACNSWGVTRCVPPFRPRTDPDGRQANLDGDLCICRCPTPPRLKALFDNVGMDFDGREIMGMPGAIPWRAHAGHAMEEHEIFYEVVDAETGKPIGGMAYKMTSAGRTMIDGASLECGKSNSYSINLHPNLAFITWIDGNRK